MIFERLRNLPIIFDQLGLEGLSQQKLKSIVAVDACLPQTQCGLCDHPEGCLPYAVAIVMNDEPHNRCVPGGQPVSDSIADILHRPTLTARPSQWSTDPKTLRPKEIRAVIIEDDCIGCTKCIPACPVDAIIGTGKHMHTIITELCTGCELCLSPCPVDCIDLVEMPYLAPNTPSERMSEQEHLRRRYHTHLNHVKAQIFDDKNDKPVTSMVETKLGNASSQSLDISESHARATIEAATLRSKIKKLKKQLSMRPNTSKMTELTTLQQHLNDIE